MANKNNLPKFTRNMYQGPIDDSAPVEVYRRPTPEAKTKKPSYPVKEVDYSLGAYQRRFGQKPRTKLVDVNNRWSKIMDDYSYTPTVNATLPEVDVVAKRKTNNTTSNTNAVTNTNLPDVVVTGTRRNTTSNTNAATAKPATTTTAPITRRTNTTRRPARLANRNESTVNDNSVKIKAGDTLYDIAKRLTGDGNNYKEFLKYNNIKDPNKIYAGDNLVIPEKFRKIKSNSERRNAAHQAERIRRVKERTNFTLPDNLDEDYAQLQPREGGRRTLENAGKY